MQIKKDYQAVIFDLDGTLVDSMWIWQDIDIAYLKRHGHALPDDLQKQIEGMSTTETANYFKARFRIDDSVEDIKAEWIDMAAHYYAERIELKRGVTEWLARLQAQGLKLGIATSNFRELAEAVLARHQLLSAFDSLRTSCEFERGKPFPDVFLAVAKDLGVKPANCLVFEDTHAGVIAAKRAGMDVIAVEDALSKPYRAEIARDSLAVIVDFTEMC